MKSVELFPQDIAKRVDQVAPRSREKIEKTKDPSKTGQFSELLTERLDRQEIPERSELKFSAHARARLESRKIDLSADEMLKMQEAVQKAQDKGSRESLILTDKAAYVVSVKNNTVITAMDKSSIKDNVFTNIDSTIMI